MSKLKELNQSGIASILSVVIFATIITVVVAGFVGSVVNQQNEANNYDFGTRAYYAAESGIQDALRSINMPQNAALLNADRNNCGPLLDGGLGNNGDLGFNLNYTCQLISPIQGSTYGDVAPQTKNVTMKLQPKSVAPTGTPNYTLLARWSSKTAVGDSSTRYPRNGDFKTFTPLDEWMSSGIADRPIHPLLRLSIIEVPKSTNTVNPLSRNSIRQQVVFFNPVTDGKQESVSLARGANQDPATAVINARCFTSDGSEGAIPANYSVGGRNYSCMQPILLTGYNLNDYDLYVRVGSVYWPTNFDLQLTTDGVTPLPLVNSQVSIDVTGKSGNVYRRVKQNFSIANGFNSDEWPDAAIVAGDGICKRFAVGTTNTQYSQGCDPTQ